MPDGEILPAILELTGWIEWYEYVRQEESKYSSECPDFIKDSPSQFFSWCESEQNKEKSKEKGINPYRR